MNRVDCENCKNYFNWSDVIVLPDGNGLFVKKIVLMKCDEDGEKVYVGKEDKKEVKKKKGRFAK